MPAAVPIIVGGAVASGAAATVGAAIVGATVSTAVATAVGAGVIAGGASLAMGAEPEDALKTAVISGVTAGIGPSIGAAVAPTADVAIQQAISGAVLGGGVAAISGGDPLRGAITGAIASVTTSAYSADVGYAMGATTDATAKVIGNATINAGLSGLQAAATGGDISKSMLAGAVTGGIMADPSAVANALVGGESNLRALIENTNLTLSQAQNIISTSAGNAVVAELRGRNFSDELRDGLIAGGISTSVANAVGQRVDENLSPEARNAVFTGTKGITDTAVRAGLNNQNIEEALRVATPDILISTVLEYQNTQTELKKREELNKKLTGFDQNQKVLLAQVPTDTLSDAIEGIPMSVLKEIVVTADRDNVADTVELATSFWDRLKRNFATAAKPEASTVALLTGVVNGTKSVLGFFGAGPTGIFGGTMANLDRIERRLQEFLTAEAVGDRDRAYKIMKQAEGEGVWAEVKAGAQAFMERPVLASLEAAGSIVPQILVAAASAPASVLGKLTALGTTGAMMGVGETKNEIFREVYGAARGRGLDDVDALEMATRASAYSGPAADQQALAAFIGTVTSVGPFAGLEKALVRDIGVDSAARIAGRATAAGLIEKLTETGQAFQQNVASNVAINRLRDPASDESKLLGDWSEASRAYRDFVFANPWVRDTFEGATAQAVYEGLSSAASATAMSAGVDLSARAKQQAQTLGVNWELLDPVTRTDLTIRSLNPADIIDVVARDVTPLPSMESTIAGNEALQRDILSLENQLKNTPKEVETGGVVRPNPRYFLLQDQLTQRRLGYTPATPVLTLSPPTETTAETDAETRAAQQRERIQTAERRRLETAIQEQKRIEEMLSGVSATDERFRVIREEQRARIAEERAGLVNRAEEEKFLQDMGVFNRALGNIGKEILTTQEQISLIDTNLAPLQLQRRDLVMSGALTGRTNSQLMERINQLAEQREPLIQRLNQLEEQQRLATVPEKRSLTDQEVVNVLGLGEPEIYRYGFDIGPPGGTPPTTEVAPGAEPETIFGFSPDVVTPEGDLRLSPLITGVYGPDAEGAIPGEFSERLPLRPVTIGNQPTGEFSIGAASYPYDPSNPDETWLGGKFRISPDSTDALRNYTFKDIPQMQEANIYSALRRASGVEEKMPQTFLTPSYYSYGRETTPAESLNYFRKGGSVTRGGLASLTEPSSESDRQMLSDTLRIDKYRTDDANLALKNLIMEYQSTGRGVDKISRVTGLPVEEISRMFGATDTELPFAEMLQEYRLGEFKDATPSMMTDEGTRFRPGYELRSIPRDLTAPTGSESLEDYVRRFNIQRSGVNPSAQIFDKGGKVVQDAVIERLARNHSQKPGSGGKIGMSPLLIAGEDSVSHKGTHHVQGEGGGQDDLIPAKLADGEYVFDAEIVAALGDGSNKEGAKILDKFREEIRKHKRSGSKKTIPPKAKSPLAYLRSATS